MRLKQTTLIALAAMVATTAGAQRPAAAPTPAVPPARAVAPMAPVPAQPAPFATYELPEPVLAPVAAPMAFELPQPALAPVAPIAFELPDPVIAPEAPMALFQGPGRPLIDRTEIDRIAREKALEAQDMIREQSQMVREQAQIAREQALEQSQLMREQARLDAERVRTLASTMAVPSVGFGAGFGAGFGGTLGTPRPPVAWAQRDPADSLYRAANEAMNKGDYRKAAGIFKEIPVRFQYSVYAADAMYWTAHALYRVGTTPDLQDALATLEQLKQRYPNSRLRGNQSDVAALQVRIAGVLAARGQGGSDIVKRALAQNANVCDAEEQQIRSAALNALMQTDADAANDYAQKVLARKDDCSRDMRRTAVFLIGNKGDPKATSTLISVAKSDPAPDVRSAAVQYLGRMPGDDALGALEDLAKSDTGSQVQREAIRQLARSANPRARNGIKALVERNDVSESLRITALDALDPEKSTGDDVKWLQATYAKVDNPRIKARMISAMARIGGADNEKWFATLANNENESIDVRVEALRRAGQSMDIAALGRLYDQTGQRSLRSELIRQLGNRREPDAIDKLGDIAKTGTDPQLRTRAIEALSNSKDPRATKLILQLIDRP